MTDYQPCSTPPECPGLYEVQRMDAGGEPFDAPEMMRFDGIDWINRFGLPVLPTDVWRDVTGDQK